MSVDRNGMAHEPKGSANGGRFAPKRGVGGDDDLDEDPRIRFERVLQERLDRPYPTARAALDEAKDLESYTGGIRLKRDGTAGVYRLEERPIRDCVDATLSTDENGSVPYDMDFSGGSPDDYRIVNAMDTDYWRDLPAVRDFLDGREESVEISTLMPTVFYGEYDDPDSDLMLICAWRGSNDESDVSRY